MVGEYEEGFINFDDERERRGIQKPIRYPVTQETIDNILANELKDFNFQPYPVYKSNLRGANGITRFIIYPWGQTKVTSIEIGKQDKPERKFLIDTLLHEYFEALILEKQHTEEYYAKLHKMADNKRHEWINKQIIKFFDEMEGKQ